MKAIIMAGGEGSRLRPLTCNLPKPMARLCGFPVMEHILELLSLHGTDSAAVTVKYLPHSIEDYFESGTYKNMGLSFCHENDPLGTAGGVKNAVLNSGMDFNDDFLVISGDAMCDIDLTAAYAFHKESGAMATLIVTRVMDPREYGLVSSNPDGTVTGFIEKPGWNQAVTDSANTGIYIINPECLRLIPDGKSFDFAKNLFPEMMRQGMKIAAFETTDNWLDIGDIDTYISCCADILSGKMNAPLYKAMKKPAMPEGEYKIIEPVFIGDNVHIGEGAVIGPMTVLDDNTTVGAMARIRGSVVLPGGYVGERSRMTGALVCAGGSVRQSAFLFEGAVVGSDAVVGEYAEIHPNVRIWPGKTVEKGVILSENLQYGGATKEFFDDDGIKGEAGIDITPEFCARLGAAIGSLKGIERVGIGFSGGAAAKAFKACLESGVLSTGSQVWDFGEVMQSQMAFAVAFCGLKAAAYVSGGSRTVIGISTEGGLPAGRALERELYSVLTRGEFARCSWDSYRDTADMNGIELLYQQELYRSAPGGLTGISAKARCQNKQGERLFADTLMRLGCETSEGMTLNLSPCGTKLSITEPTGAHYSFEKVLCMCCILELKDGHDLYLPYDAPRVLDALAAKFGKSAYRYLSSPADDGDRDVRLKTRFSLWIRDGMMSALRLLSYLKESSETLQSLAASVPDFALVEQVLELSEPPTVILSKLQSDERGDGVFIKSGSGSVLVRPMKKGNKLRILAESVSAETAQELCDGLIEKLGLK